MVIRAISVLCWSGCVKFVGGNQSKKSKDDLDKEDPYSLATVEASGNGRNEGLWGKCFVEADGNETKTKVLYIKRRVEQLEESPLDLSQQEAEESLLHWWRRIMFGFKGGIETILVNTDVILHNRYIVREKIVDHPEINNFQSQNNDRCPNPILVRFA